MVASNYPKCIDLILKYEGGYVDNPHDNGGATNLGITIKTLTAWRSKPVTKDDVRNLTLDEAKQIYRAWYWQPVRGDDLPAGVDLCAFDVAVNSGPSRAAKFLQLAVGTQPDGMIGKQTVEAAQAAHPVAVINRMCDDRLAWLRRLDDWQHFGKGWTNRIEDMRQNALKMALDDLHDTHQQKSHQTPSKAPATNPLVALIAAIIAVIAFIFGRKK